MPALLRDGFVKGRGIGTVDAKTVADQLVIFLSYTKDPRGYVKTFPQEIRR